MEISRKKVNFYIIGEYNNFKNKKLFIEFLLKIEWIDNKNETKIRSRNGGNKN